MKGHKHIKKGESGYSLVEILVVVAIMGIVGTIAIPNFTGLSSRSRLKSASRNIVNDMQLARTKALRDRSTWTIQFDTGSASYTVLNGSTVYKTLDLSEYSGISLGSGYGERPDEPNTGSTDGVSFASDMIQFNGDGTSVAGSVYLKNDDNHTSAIGCLSAAGRIKTWFNFGDGWED